MIDYIITSLIIYNFEIFGEDQILVGISYYGFIPEQIFLKLVENDLSNGPTTQGVFGMMENIFTQNIKKNVSDTNSSKNENSSD